jgi:hypothetical protein
MNTIIRISVIACVIELVIDFHTSTDPLNDNLVKLRLCQKSSNFQAVSALVMKPFAT